LRQVLEVMKAEKVDKIESTSSMPSSIQLSSARPLPGFTGLVYYIKVASVSVNVEIQSKQLPVRWDMSNFVQFVLHNITSGKNTLVVKPKV